MTDPADFDRDVRATIANSIKERGAIPTIAEVAARMPADAANVNASFARMIEAHVFIPERGTREIHAYNPFCIGPTDFRVRAGGRDWSAICGWDALGIPAALGTAGTVETSCGDGCGETIRIDVAADGAATGTAVFHSGVPIREAWADIHFT